MHETDTVDMVYTVQGYVSQGRSPVEPTHVEKIRTTMKSAGHEKSHQWKSKWRNVTGNINDKSKSYN
jgi:hypothetical protein